MPALYHAHSITRTSLHSCTEGHSALAPAAARTSRPAAMAGRARPRAPWAARAAAPRRAAAPAQSAPGGPRGRLSALTHGSAPDAPRRGLGGTGACHSCERVRHGTPLMQCFRSAPPGLCASHSGRGAAAATTSRQAPLPGIFCARALMCRLQARAGRARRSPRLPRLLHGCAAPRHNRRRGKRARLRRRYEPHARVLLHPLRAAAAAAGRGPPPGLPPERHIAGAARLPSSRACRE